MAAPGPAAPAAGQAAGGSAADGAAADGAQAPDGGSNGIDAVLSGIAESVESQRQLLESRPWEVAADDQTQQPQDGQDDLDLGFLDETQAGYTPEKAIADLGALIDARAEGKAQALVAPLVERLGNVENNAAIDDLVAQYPQFGEPAVAKAVIEHSRAWAEQVGAPELGSNPEVYRIMYLAGRALDAQQREEAAGGDAGGRLEGGGGASPGGAGQGTDALTTETITAGWKGAKLPLFG